jgi:hypothetical protein
MAAMFVGSSTANAAAGDAGVCVFTGLAGDLAPGIPNIESDLVPDAEGGSYTYGGPATCAGVFEGETVNTGLDGATITSSGEYLNVYCGTGIATDSNPNISFGSIAISAPYVIPFVAGNGPLVIGASVEGLAPAVDPSYVGLGAVHITPGRDSDAITARDNCVMSPPDDPADDTTDDFQVAGAFVAVGTGL